MRKAKKILSWARGIRGKVAISLGLLVVSFAGSAMFALYELDLRKHDYAILALAGQLRVSSLEMTREASDFLVLADSDASPARKSEAAVDLKKKMIAASDLYDRIVAGFEKKELPGDLIGRAEPLSCSWDRPSILRLNETAADWRGFRAALEQAAGDWGLESGGARRGALYALTNGPDLERSSLRLATGFQEMMEKKAAAIRLLTEATIGLAAVMALLIAWILRRGLTGPLKEASDGFLRVARGDFSHRIPVAGNDEIGQMSTAFNSLAERLSTIFRISSRASEAHSVGESLLVVSEELGRIVPIHWAGIFFEDKTQGGWVLERSHGEKRPIEEGERFEHLDSTLRGDFIRAGAAEDFGAIGERLGEGGMHSISAIFLEGAGPDNALLVFAAKDSDAYGRGFLEILSSVAGHFARELDKTVFLESLVIATVQGLAKLAESRDPETGDHLIRMARYSAFIAEELGKDGALKGKIRPDFVRQILRFAPMHDIGKVGVPDSILLKPGKLDEKELEQMRRHPTIGAEALRRCESQVNALGHSIFEMGIEIAQSHHERYDGRGYPQGLSGDAIPLAARIVAAADVFDALTSKRPYKEAWSIAEALEAMRNDSGKHFDPIVVAALERALPKILRTYEELKHV